MKISVTSPMGLRLKEDMRRILMASNKWYPGSYLKRKKNGIPFFAAVEKYLGVRTEYDDVQKSTVFVIGESDEAATMMLLRLTGANE